MKLDKHVVNFLQEVKEQGQEVLENVVEYIKDHKKLVIIGVVAFLVYKWLFQEEEDY